MTEWRAIPGFEAYEVSTDGAVRSMKRRNIRTKDQHDNGNGYFYVTLFMNNQASHLYVHRLVLLAFVGPCPDGMEARHLNGVRSDNRLANLAWGSKLENAADMQAHGTQPRGDRHGARTKPWRWAKGDDHWTRRKQRSA